VNAQTLEGKGPKKLGGGEGTKQASLLVPNGRRPHAVPFPAQSQKNNVKLTGRGLTGRFTRKGDPNAFLNFPWEAGEMNPPEPRSKMKKG